MASIGSCGQMDRGERTTRKVTHFAARASFRRRRFYVATVLLLPVVLLLVWASVAPALTLPALGSHQPPTIAAHDHSLALQADGSLWAFGHNWYGQLGDGTMVDRPSPTHIGTANGWRSVAAGFLHSVALKSDGTLWAWGENGSGQLGDGTTTDHHIPTRIGTGSDWSAISSGSYHTLALKSDGTLWGWGYNEYGQLGDGTTATRLAPTRIGMAADWVAVSAGISHSLALKSDGTLWAWGNNDCGQLADGTTTTRLAPTRIGIATDWAAVSAGGCFSLALKSDGTLWGWGSNTLGQLADGTTTRRLTPRLGGWGVSWASVSAGSCHALALKADGSLWAWGCNLAGQLGIGTGGVVDAQSGGVLTPQASSSVYSSAPLRVGYDTDWVEVAAGYNHSVALKSDGSLWAWGDNDYGQVGSGTAYSGSRQLTPLQVWTATSSTTSTTTPAPTGFLPNPDGYQFENLAYSDPSAATQVFTHLFGASLFDTQGAQQSMSPSGQQTYVNINGVWAGGICFGMASTSIAYFEDHLRTQDVTSGVTTLWDLGTFGVTMSDPSGLPANLKWNLEEYYTAQCSSLVHDTMFDSTHYVEAGYSSTSDIRTLVQAIATQVQTEPVILCVWGMLNGKEAGHAIVAYRVDSAPDGNSGTIWVYDSNLPGVPHGVTYDLQAGTWSYPELFSSCTLLAYVPVSLVYSVVDSTVPVSYYPGWVYTNTACNIAFEDAYGHVTGKTASGYVSDNPQVQLEPLLDGGAGQTTVDRYAVAGSMDREFTLKQVGSQPAYAGSHGSSGSYLVCSEGDSGESVSVTVPRSGTDVQFSTASDTEVFLAAENGSVWATASFEQDGGLAQAAAGHGEGRLAVLGFSQVIVEQDGQEAGSVSVGDATEAYTLSDLPVGQRLSIDVSSYDASDGTLTVRIDADGNGSYESTQEVATDGAPGGGGGTTSFWDVSASHPYYDAIIGMAEAEVISGFTDGSFGPTKLVTRQQFAKMIVGTMGFPCSEADVCSFSDVSIGGPSTLYPDNYVAVCALYNITKGKDATHFAPHDSITRAQVITMVVRAAQSYTAGLAAPNAAYADWGLFYGWGDPTHGYNAQLAEFNGLLTGIQGSGSISTWALQPATRGEVAQILWNLMNTPGLAG